MTDSAVEKRDVQWGDAGVQLSNLTDAYRWAQYVVASGLAPKGLSKPESVLVALQCGMELGFSAMQSLSVVHVIQGRPSLSVEAMAARVESAGALEPGTKLRFRYEGEGAELACVAWSQPRGGKVIESDPVYLSEFQHLAGNDNWKRYPKRMLKARAVGFHIRDNYAGHVRNLPTSEELFDLGRDRGTTMRDITPAPAGPDPLLASLTGGAPPDPAKPAEALEDADAGDAPGEDAAGSGGTIATSPRACRR